MIKVKGLLATGAIIATLSALGACTSEPPVAAPTAAPSTVVPSASEPETTAAAECSPPAMIEGSLRILSDMWSTVLTARGEPDELRQFKAFDEQVDTVAENYEDTGCDEQHLAALKLAAEAAMLNATLTADLSTDDEEYDSITAAGNELLAAQGIDDTRFGDSAI